METMTSIVLSCAWTLHLQCVFPVTLYLVGWVGVGMQQPSSEFNAPIEVHEALHTYVC